MINGVVNEEVLALVVVASAVPPAEFAYHRKVPDAPADALRATVPGLQEIPSVPVTVVAVPRVAVTAVRGLVHDGEDVVKLT